MGAVVLVNKSLKWTSMLGSTFITKRSLWPNYARYFFHLIFLNIKVPLMLHIKLQSNIPSHSAEFFLLFLIFCGCIGFSPGLILPCIKCNCTSEECVKCLHWFEKKMTEEVRGGCSGVKVNASTGKWLRTIVGVGRRCFLSPTKSSFSRKYYVWCSGPIWWKS